MFNNEDLNLLAKKGITPQQVEQQLQSFKDGFPFLELDAAASVGNGVLSPSENEINEYIKMWEDYCNSGHTITKFVPASGAASRMFKDLFGFLDAEYTIPTTDFEKKFFESIENFAFYNDLNAACLKNESKEIPALIADENYKAVVANLLNKSGLNYGSSPKGVLKFHKYDGNNARTPLEEHMAEGALYACGSDSTVHLHFTVSPEHRSLFTTLAENSKEDLANKYGVTYDISFSEQKASTDTIAADKDNNPFRENDGSLLFRPGGHGALIENLNDLTSDIVFIKNIDNVVPDHFKADTVTYKKVLAGILVSIESKIFEYLNILDSKQYDRELLNNIAAFLQDTICCRIKGIESLNDEELANVLYGKLNRPIRVCGMVKNVGEPGGGPFLAYNSDGSISLQILESSQIDMNDQAKKEMFTKGTHFNPVDLVCALRGYKGDKFNLPDFVDKSTGFISSKSKSGRELKALELPGLWNGAMSNWNTIFVEVPLSTFNPVKTVNDLLRKQHQPS